MHYIGRSANTIHTIIDNNIHEQVYFNMNMNIKSMNMNNISIQIILL